MNRAVLMSCFVMRPQRPRLRGPLELLPHSLGALCLSLTLSLSLWPAALEAKPLNLDQLREEAKAAYAAGKFSVAQRKMTRVVQALPDSASDYLMLARSAYSDKDHAQASAAYSFYFKLNQRPDQRPKDEYKRVKSLVTAQKDKRFIKATLERIKQLEALAKKGALGGSKGVLKALSRVQREGLFHPRLKRAYREIEGALKRAQSALLESWWLDHLSLEPKQLIEQSEHWQRWGWSIAGDEGVAERQVQLLKVLVKLKDEPQEALELMKTFMAESSGYELRHRHILLICLLSAERDGEALELARSLSDRASGAELLRLQMIETYLSAQVSQEAGQAPSEQQLTSLVDQLYQRSKLKTP